MEAKDQERMEAKETNHPSFNPLSSRSTNSEEEKDEGGGREQDISAHDGQESNSEASLCSTPVLSSFASYDMADKRFECEVDEIPDFDYLSPSSRWISRKDVFGSNSSSRSTWAVPGRRAEENHAEISHPIRLAQRIRNAAHEGEVFKEECLIGYVNKSRSITKILQNGVGFVNNSMSFLWGRRRETLFEELRLGGILLNLVEMQNTREIYMTIRNFKGDALFEKLVDLEDFQSHLANFFQM